MSTRKITKEQFSDGSTIDGSRIARAIEDAVGYNNEVPLEAINKPRMPQFVVLGANPASNAVAATISPPWLNYNLQDPAVAGQVNFRAKGMAVSVTASGVYPVTDGGLWTVSTLFDRPVVIDSVCVHIDSWAPWPIKLTGPGGTGTAHASLLQLMIDTDNVHAPEDRTVNSKEYHYRQYDPSVWYAMNLNNNVAPATDMTPAPPTALKDGTAPAAGLYSVVIEQRNIDLPIHQLARVRFRLGFGRPDTSVSAPGGYSWESGGSATMHPGQPTWVIVYREQLRG